MLKSWFTCVNVGGELFHELNFELHKPFLFERVTAFAYANLELSLRRSENRPLYRSRGGDAVIFQQSIQGKTEGEWVVRVRLTVRLSARISNRCCIRMLGNSSAFQSEESSKWASRLGNDSLSRLQAAEDKGNTVGETESVQMFGVSTFTDTGTLGVSLDAKFFTNSCASLPPRWCGLI